MNVIPLKPQQAVGKIPMDDGEKISRPVAVWGAQNRDPSPGCWGILPTCPKGVSFRSSAFVPTSSKHKFGLPLIENPSALCCIRQCRSKFRNQIKSYVSKYRPKWWVTTNYLTLTRFLHLILIFLLFCSKQIYFSYISKRILNLWHTLGRIQNVLSSSPSPIFLEIVKSLII